jgi:Zn-dependent peptidase ImmA (M78 family)
MTRPHTDSTKQLLLQVRKLFPKRHLTYGQAHLVAEMQAAEIRKLLNINEMRLPLDWVEQIPGVSVTLLTRDEMEQLSRSPAASGATDVRRDGTYRIYITENNSITHCRFTMAHELFHVIAGPYEADVFRDFGHGDAELHARRLELLADHFAAALLMPKNLVKKAWDVPIRGLSELAACFGVSEDAMQIRLKHIGLIRSGLRKDMFYRRPFATWTRIYDLGKENV